MERLCVVATKKRGYGYVCLPYIVNVDSAPSYILVEQATKEVAKSGRFDFTEAELTVLNKLSELTDTALCNRFSRGKTVKAFLDGLDDKTVESFILPFIDRCLSVALPIIVSENILFFNKPVGYSSLYETDIIKTYDSPSRAKCFFTLDDTKTLRYSLSILDKLPGGKSVETCLTSSKVVEVMHSPAALVVDNVLHYFTDIDAKKFQPFYTKKFILVQPQNVDKYMQTFVRKCVMSHYVVAYGFKIVRRAESFVPVLCIEQGVMGYYAHLYFRYGNNRYSYLDSHQSVDLELVDGGYVFFTCLRNRVDEDTYASMLTDYELEHVDNEVFRCHGISSERDIYPYVEWVNRYQIELSDAGFEIVVSSDVDYYRGSVGLTVDTSDCTDWFDLRAVVNLDGYMIPFVKLRSNILYRKRDYVLPDGRVFVIPEEWFAQWADVMHFCRQDGDSIRVDAMHKSLVPADYMPYSDVDDKLTLSSTERCGEIRAVLRPYQESGFMWLNTLCENGKGGILADDMGLGKTLQTLSMLSHIFAKAEKRSGNDGLLLTSYNDTVLPPAIIVVPVSLIHNWMSEIHKFAPHLCVYHYWGRNRLKSAEIGRIFRHYHIVITSYGLLRNDIGYLSSYEFSYLILDESQYVKNPSSVTYRSVSQLKSFYKLAISGTPIENGLNDLWAQMNLVNKGLLGTATFFKSYFVNAINNGDESRQNTLKKIISPYILRRTKDLVAKELPPVVEQTISCEMTDDQRQIYESERSACRNELMHLSSGIQQESFLAIKALTRLRLVANHPVMAVPDYNGRSGKIDCVVEQINNIVASGHKLLVFSSFVKDLELVRLELEHLHISYCMLVGQTKNRSKQVDLFNEDDTRKVFLISLKAGGVGLNLTAADYVIMLNPWWNPQAEKQAIDRAHRIGQTKTVFVYKFITVGTIEEKIAMLQEKKRQIAGEYITNNNPLVGLSTEEIKELLYGNDSSIG